MNDPKPHESMQDYIDRRLHEIEQHGLSPATEYDYEDWSNEWDVFQRKERSRRRSRRRRGVTRYVA